MLLAYVYGDGLKHQNGRVWSLDTGLQRDGGQPRRLLLRGGGVPECQWNHLHEAFTARRAAAG